MKKALLATAVFAIATAPAFAQTTSAKPVSSTDQTFIMNTAKAGMAEVELGKLALQNASSDAVKKFGQKMVDDHTKANDNLKQAADQAGIELPADTSAKHKQLVQKLSGLSGAAFDKAYMDAMVKDHVEDVAEFEKASKAPGNSPIRTFAASTLPTLKEHLQMAREIDSEVKGAAARSGAGSAKPASGGTQSY